MTPHAHTSPPPGDPPHDDEPVSPPSRDAHEAALRSLEWSRETYRRLDQLEAKVDASATATSKKLDAALESLAALRLLADEIPQLHGRIKDVELGLRVASANNREQSARDTEQDLRLRHHSMKLRAHEQIVSRRQLAGGASLAALLGAAAAELLKHLFR